MKNTLVLIASLLSVLNSNAQSTNIENYFIFNADEYSADVIYLSAYPEERVILQMVLTPGLFEQMTPNEKADAKRILNRIKNDLNLASQPMLTHKGM